MLVVLTAHGDSYALEPEIRTNWPGPMYPPGFMVVDDNEPYTEAEDEFDTVGTWAYNPSPRPGPDHNPYPNPP